METDNCFKKFEELKVHLSECKDKQNLGKDLHSHMGEVMSHMVTHCPQEALNKLEEISYLMRNNDPEKTKEFLKMDEIHCYSLPSDAATKEATKENIDCAK